MIQIIQDAVTGIINTLLGLLPRSPFRPLIDALELPASAQVMGWLNWFFPVADCLEIFAAWLAVMVLFFLYRVLMKWVKLL